MPRNSWVPDQRRTTSCCVASGTPGMRAGVASCPRRGAISTHRASVSRTRRDASPAMRSVVRCVAPQIRDPRLYLLEHRYLPDGQISAQFFGMLLRKLPPMSAKSPARKIKIRKPFQTDLPCPVPRAKKFRFPSSSIRWFVAPSRLRHEGRIAIVTTREAGCDGRNSARDERGLCGRRSRVVLAPLGWRQVGDDALHRADDGD